MQLAHLSDAEVRACVSADNKLAENAGWDQDLLAVELQALVDQDFDVELAGFGVAKIDIVLHEARGGDQPADLLSLALEARENDPRDPR